MEHEGKAAGILRCYNEEIEEQKIYDEIQTIKKDLVFQLSFGDFDIDYFIETAERIKEIEANQKEQN